MSVSEREFSEALQCAIIKHSELNADTGRMFISKLTRALANNRRKPKAERDSYPILLRKVLNDANFKGASRTAYASLAGHYFGKRGARAKAAKRLMSAKTSSISNPSTEVIQVGQQLQWVF